MLMSSSLEPFLLSRISLFKDKSLNSVTNSVLLFNCVKANRTRAR